MSLKSGYNVTLAIFIGVLGENSGYKNRLVTGRSRYKVSVRRATGGAGLGGLIGSDLGEWLPACGYEGGDLGLSHAREALQHVA